MLKIVTNKKWKNSSQQLNLVFILNLINPNPQYSTFSLTNNSTINYVDFFPGFQTIEYFKIFIMFIFIFLISLLLFTLAYFFSLSSLKNNEKLSQYECGFEPFDEATRQPFDIHFYVVGILFLIFDVEIALLFPWVLTIKHTNWFSFLTMSIFLIILTIGFFYEWHRGALLWPKDKIQNNNSECISN